jgi:hypothetical protein
MHACNAIIGKSHRPNPADLNRINCPNMRESQMLSSPFPFLDNMDHDRGAF